MKYTVTGLPTAAHGKADASVLIIYTGGTMGMVYDESGTLVPFDFAQIVDKVPSLRTFNLELSIISFPHLIDSSNVRIDHWVAMGEVIKDRYDKYDGFVILHGTDTMSYSACALSYMLEGLNKPVIFTGAQLPIGAARSDARENLITAIEIASAKREGHAIVPEVCVFFHSYLIRGNRSKKIKSVYFDAFESENYPLLATAGIKIEYNKVAISPYVENKELCLHQGFDANVTILKLFPGLGQQVVESVLHIEGLKGVILETYGSGNAPTASWFLDAIKELINRNIVVLNISQCDGGRVIQGRYETSQALKDIGVIGGADMTTEAAITKMMFLFGNENNIENVKSKLTIPLRGEMTGLTT